ncbi:MAG: nicotinate-nucleotide adenylyltransferase [Bacteroidetes bacterium]|nr:MAG: nicotinate-nucleotide adenylyltransferase [Bacteroidota bacterium]
MNIGLFFGSFNPIHIGHLIIANIAVQSADIQKVCFVISPQNPFKKSKGLLHEFDRYDLVQRAISDNPKFMLSDVEFNLPKPSYTIDTLSVLQQKFPQDSFQLILGEDNLEHFTKWKEYQKILDNFGLLVFPRPNSQIDKKIENSPNIRKINAPLLDISATFIRNAIKNNQSIKYLVTENVEQMILSKRFYT